MTTIIRSCDMMDGDVTRFNEQFDLWLINDRIEDDEGFWKNCFYVARRRGKMLDWEVLSPRLGSSYTSCSDAMKMAKEWAAPYIVQRLQEA